MRKLYSALGKSISEMRITATSPEAEGTAALLNRLTEASRAVFADHPVNVARRAAGKREARTMWLWSPGSKPTMQTLSI